VSSRSGGGDRGSSGPRGRCTPLMPLLRRGSKWVQLSRTLVPGVGLDRELVGDGREGTRRAAGPSRLLPSPRLCALYQLSGRLSLRSTCSWYMDFPDASASATIAGRSPEGGRFAYIPPSGCGGPGGFRAPGTSSVRAPTCQVNGVEALRTEVNCQEH
jgi:hypothetical protein